MDQKTASEANKTGQMTKAEQILKLRKDKAGLNEFELHVGWIQNIKAEKKNIIS